MTSTTIKATCSCGASLEITSWAPDAEAAYRQFLKAHDGCERIEAGRIGPVATPSTQGPK